MESDSFSGLHPEIGAGGYKALDGTVEFYGRINALIRPEMYVLDFGAGRGAWYEDDTSRYRVALRCMRGKVARVVACDVDDAVLANRSVDDAFTFRAGGRLPLDDASVDLVIADYVFEHIEDVGWISAELTRVLRPGGWVCARTPTRTHYVSLIARCVPNRRHSKVIGQVQPGRKERDVFPTRYRLNSIRDIERAFPHSKYDSCSYVYSAEPSYYFGRMWLYRLFVLFHWLAPKALHGNLFVFLRKK